MTGDWRLATGDWRLATGDWRLPDADKRCTVCPRQAQTCRNFSSWRDGDRPAIHPQSSSSREIPSIC